jgi:hypothetical protein
MTWGPLKADGRMAAKSALKIRAALAQTAEFKRVYESYLATQPNQSDKPAQDRARARAWVMLNVRVNMMALMGVLERVYAEGWVTGEAAADEAIAKAKEARKAFEDDLIDWSLWNPGDEAAALLLRPTKAFQRFLESFGITLKELTNTTINDIGNSIADALEQGLSANQAAKLIRRNVATSHRALTIAITEQNRALSSTPAIPITRSGGNPVRRHISSVISSSGLVTTTTTASSTTATAPAWWATSPARTRRWPATTTVAS